MASTCEGVPPVPTGSTFTGWDYLVFGIILAISTAIGIYYACSGGKQRTTAEYLLADKSMSAIPVSLSMFATFISAATLLGTPAEIYTQGTMYWMTVWSVMLTPIFGAAIFGPFFHRLKILSAFEYLEIRYKSKAVRIFGCLMYALKLVITIGIVIFGPAAAFTEVTGFPVWSAIVTIGLVCVFYTTLGGMKAVIWADVFQATIMFAGLLASIIQGCIETGGIQNAWKLAKDGGRIELFEALLLNVPGLFVIMTLSSLLGVVMYGYYAPMNCDPLMSGRVTNPNQLVPRFVMDIFRFAPGIPGLYVASLFAGSLSTSSSMLNALATVVWEDIFKMFRPAREASDKNATIAAKLLCVVFAACGIGMAFLFSNAGGTILQMMIAFNGATVAPVFGIYMLGFFFPWVNWIGALAGGIPGFAFSMWVSIGAYVTKAPVYKSMYYSIECCDVTTYNSTSSSEFFSNANFHTTPTTTVPEVFGVAQLYMLSYLWYTALGILTTVIVGLIVSFLTGNTKPKDVDPKLLISYVDKFWCCFPESCRSKFRCGIDFSKVDDPNFTSEIGEPEDTMEVLDSKTNIIYVYPDKISLNGYGQKPNPSDGIITESAISLDEPPASTDTSIPFVNNDLNVGCNNKTYKCLDEMEISKL